MFKARSLKVQKARSRLKIHRDESKMVRRDEDGDREGGEGNWACRRCTLLNPMHRNFCEACNADAPRSRDGPSRIKSDLNMALKSASSTSKVGALPSGNVTPLNSTFLDTATAVVPRNVASLSTETSSSDLKMASRSASKEVALPSLVTSTFFDHDRMDIDDIIPRIMNGRNDTYKYAAMNAVMRSLHPSVCPPEVTKQLEKCQYLHCSPFFAGNLVGQLGLRPGDQIKELDMFPYGNHKSWIEKLPDEVWFGAQQNEDGKSNLPKLVATFCVTHYPSARYFNTHEAIQIVTHGVFKTNPAFNRITPHGSQIGSHVFFTRDDCRGVPVDVSFLTVFSKEYCDDPLHATSMTDARTTMCHCVDENLPSLEIINGNCNERQPFSVTDGVSYVLGPRYSVHTTKPEEEKIKANYKQRDIAKCCWKGPHHWTKLPCCDPALDQIPFDEDIDYRDNKEPIDHLVESFGKKKEGGCCKICGAILKNAGVQERAKHLKSVHHNDPRAQAILQRQSRWNDERLDILTDALGLVAMTTCLGRRKLSPYHKHFLVEPNETISCAYCSFCGKAIFDTTPANLRKHLGNCKVEKNNESNDDHLNYSENEMEQNEGGESESNNKNKQSKKTEATNSRHR